MCPDEDRMIEECVFLAAKSPMSDGQLLLDWILIYAHTVRRARAAKFPPSCVEVLEADLLRVLQGFYRRVDMCRNALKD